jgi:hypothetical protein
MATYFNDDVTFTLRLGLGSTWQTAPGSIDWTDVSTYVRAITTRRGRSFELDTFSAGSMTVDLSNADGRFAPNDTNSPYSPNLKVWVPVDFRYSYNSTTYNVFTGFITGFSQLFPGMRDAVTRLTVAGPMRALELAGLSTNISSSNESTMIGGILDAIGWPAGRRDLDAGKDTMQAIRNPGGIPSLFFLRQLVDSSNGMLYGTRSGNIRYRNRDWWSGVLASEQTFTDASGAGNRPYNRVVIAQDDAQIWTQVIVTSAGSPTVSTVNSTADQDVYGLRTLTRSAMVVSSTATRDDMAAYLLRNYKEPKERIKHIGLQPMSQSTGLWPAVGTLLIGDRVTVVNHQGSTYNQAVSIQSVGHTMTVEKDWTVSMDLAPIDPTQFWALGSTNASELGETTVVGY